jgi:transposase
MIGEQLDYKAKYQEAQAQILILKHELDQLKRLIFGAKSERFVPAIGAEQQALDFGEPEQPTIEPQIQLVEYTRKKATDHKPTGRLPLPAHLPREQVVIEPEHDVTGWKKIGEEITESLEHQPGKLYVKQYVRPKYAEPTGEGVVVAELPARPIEKCTAGASLLALILVEKYVDHLPVYRQIERLKREGIRLSTSTINDWITASCKLLNPLYEALRKEVFSCGYIQADETTLKVLDKQKKGTTHQGYHWAYHAPVEKLVYFDYRRGRGREGPSECLKDFKGYLQTDGYGGYEAFDNKRGITLIHCMAHARRMFFESKDNDKDRSDYVLQEMQLLYEIEEHIRQNNLADAEIVAIRQEKALPILKGLKEWMIKAVPSVIPKSPIGKAIHYSLQRWEKLSVYVNDAKLEIDNNQVENAIRPIALGRKNYLFAGSDEGARRSAMLYSFFGSCKRHQVNPYEWLLDVMETLPSYPINKIQNLLPHNWKKKNS